MEGISYKETLSLIEKFMIDSNIRKYCSEICKGKCCEACYEKNPYTCRRCEGRRLSCSIYLCSAIYEYFSATEEKFLRQVSGKIKKQYRIYNDLKCTHANIYFTSPDKVFFKVVRFPSIIKDMMRNLDIINIRKIMDELIRTKKKIR